MDKHNETNTQDTLYIDSSGVVISEWEREQNDKMG